MKQVTVVIPCRNERLYIEECIDAIYRCILPVDVLINVYVVDGMSDDGTRAIVQQLQDRYTTLHLIDNQLKLTPYAFNLGIEAGGIVDYIQIVGARHILSENYIFQCIEKLTNDPKTWCVGGKIINEFVNETGAIIAKVMGTTLGMGIGNFRTLEQSAYTDTVTSPMYPYWVIEKIGLFDEELIRNQDDDYNFRVSQAGGAIFFNAEISLKYYVRGNFNGLWRQFFQYGYWKVYVNRKHKSVTTLRQIVPPLFVIYLMIFLLNILSIQSLLLNIPFIVYCIAVVYFSIKLKQSNHSLSWLGFLSSFPIIHVSYGLGYLKGILEFLLLNKKPSDKQKRMSR
jgi:glycosyltransferase involved in cell wall biosynthesis